MQLSIVIPVFNEAATLPLILERVLGVGREHGWDLEIVMVDDASTDGSDSVIAELQARHPEIMVCRQARNMGKGAALRSGFARATGAVVVVQDADLEYNPRDIPRLIEPILAGEADVVYGTRFQAYGPRRVLYYWHEVGNKFLTTLSNMLTNLNLTDMEVGYKAFRKEVLATIQIEEERFGVEPELTAKVARGGWIIYEVPISYWGRTYAQGKKIGWKDGIHALYCLFKYNLRPKRKGKRHG